uniref:Riboflavin kinase n=2 Tax=Bursaphelenchus xylophilus TaxID=6326 RepID=A0A1I7SK16_BURXY
MTGCPNFKQPVLGHFPASSKLGVANKKPSFGTLNILVKTPSRYDIWFSSYDKTSHFTVTQSK